MPDGWESAGQLDITIPGDAGPNDPRIYVGQNDPIAVGMSQDAAIVLYWADQRAFLFSVEQSGGPDTGQLHISSVDEINGLKQLLDLDHNVVGNSAIVSIAQGGKTQNVDVQVIADRVDIDSGTVTELDSDTLIDIAPVGITTAEVTVHDAPIFEWVNGAGVTVSSGAIGGVETTVITLPAYDYKAGYAYRVDVVSAVTASVAPNNPILRVRKTNPAGQQFQVARIACPNAATTFPGVFSAHFRVGAADVNATLVLTLIGSGVFNAVLSAAATSPASVDVYVIGDGTIAARAWMPVLV